MTLFGKDLTENQSHTKAFQGTGLSGLAGVHFVCGELARHGWIPAMTLGNMPKVDVIVTRLDPAPKAVAVQVKTLKSQNRGSGWMIKYDNIQDEIYYVLVEMPDDGIPPRYFVLNASEMIKYSDKHPKMNSVRIPKDDERQFLAKWERLLA